MSQRILLVDGDILLHQVALACETPIQWDDDIHTLHSSMGEATFKLEQRISDLMEYLETGDVIFALSSKVNFRKTVMPTYKSNRKAVRKPLVLPELRNYLRDGYDTREFFGLEGDDVLSILATMPKPPSDTRDRIIVSLDKDFQSVPGAYCNWNHGYDAMRSGVIDNLVEAIMPVTAAEADRFHMIQTIGGDVSDGYTGVPGYGTKTAQKVLEAGKVLVKSTKVLKSGPRKGLEVEEWVEGDDGTPWEIAKSVFASAGLPEAIALSTARVARLLRHEDYNPVTGEISLWTPPGSPDPAPRLSCSASLGVQEVVRTPSPTPS